MGDRNNQHQPASARLALQQSCTAQQVRDSVSTGSFRSELGRTAPVPLPRSSVQNLPVRVHSTGFGEAITMRASQVRDACDSGPRPIDEDSSISGLLESLKEDCSVETPPPAPAVQQDEESLVGRAEDQISIMKAGPLTEHSLLEKDNVQRQGVTVDASSDNNRVPTASISPETSTDTARGTSNTITRSSTLTSTQSPRPKPRTHRLSDSGFPTAGSKGKPAVSAPATPLKGVQTPIAPPPYRHSQSENLAEANNGGFVKQLMNELQKEEYLSPQTTGGNEPVLLATPPTGKHTNSKMGMRNSQSTQSLDARRPVVQTGKLHQSYSLSAISAREEAECERNYRLLLRKAELAEKQDKLQDALDHYELALINEQRVRGENHLEVAKTFRIMARVCRKLSSSHQAVQYLEKALQICQVCEQAVDSDMLWNMHDELAQAYAPIDVQKEIENYERAIEILCMSTDVPPERLAHMHNNVGVSYHKQKKYAKSEEHLRQAKEMMSLMLVGQVETAKVHMSLGDLYKDKCDYGLAIAEYKDCLRIGEINKNESNAGIAASVNKSLADIYERTGDKERARMHRKAANEAKAEMGGDGHSRSSSAGAVGTEAVKAVSASQKEVEKAQNFHDEGQYLSCVTHYKKALEILTALEADSQDSESVMQQRALIHNNIGNAYRNIRRLADAKEHLENALQLRRFLFSNEPNEQTASTLFNLGYTFSQMRSEANYKKAIDVHKEALEMYLKLGNLDEHLKWIVSLQRSIASNYYNIGNYLESVKYYEEVKALLQQHSGKIEGELAQQQAIFNNLGNSYKKLKDYPHAKENLEMALTLAECLKFAEPDNLSLASDVAASENNIGCMYQEMEEFEQALQHQEKALMIREQIANEHADALTDIPCSLHNLGNTHFSAGSYNDAVDYYKREIVALRNLHEDTREAKVALSRVYEKMGRWQEATDCLEEG